MLGLIISISAGFTGYLTLLTEKEFNTQTSASDSQYMQFDWEEANAAGLAAAEEYAGEHDSDLPVSHYLNQGSNLIDMGRYKDAEEAFETALSNDPQNIDAIIGLGMVKFFLGSYPFASSKFDEAIHLDARNVQAWTYKAVSQANAENMNGSVESIEKATSFGASDPMAWYYAAVIYAENGDKEKAEEAISKAQSLEPDNFYIKTLYKEIAPSGSLPVTPISQKTESFTSESGSESSITDLTDDLQSMSLLYGVGEIISAEREVEGSVTTIRITFRDTMDSGIPIDYNVVLRADPSKGTAPLMVHFIDESFATEGVTPVRWTWKINGDSFKERDFTHTFHLPGQYNVDWEIRWSDGKVSTSSVYTALLILVNDPETSNPQEASDSHSEPTMM